MQALYGHGHALLIWVVHLYMVSHAVIYSLVSVMAGHDIEWES